MKGKKQLITAKVLESAEENTDYVYDLLCAEFKSACILKEAPLASAETGGVQITQTVDILYISKGGVIVISVINGNGAYDNPKAGPWRYRYLDSGGKMVTVSHPNPFDATLPAANILESLLAGEKIYLDVKRVAVFTGSKLGMTTHYPEAMPLNDLVPYLNSFNQQPVLNGPQFRIAAEIIPTYAGYNQQKILTARYAVRTSSDENEKQNADSLNKDDDPLLNDLANTPEITTETIYMQGDEAVKLLREVEQEIDREKMEENE